jgi:hypothetical protein
MMRRAALWLFCACMPVSAMAAEGWNTYNSTHFIISYHHAPNDFIERISREAENSYSQITDNLGFLRFDFWLWDDRAQIYVYDDAQEYQVSMNAPAWSAGAAVPRDKMVYTFYGREGFFEHVLPHEIGHIIFREFVGFDNAGIPLWLDEGVASYQEKETFRALLAEYVRASKQLLPLSGLFGIDPHQVGYAQAQLYYAEAVGVIDFLIKNYGKDDFVRFCRSLRDTHSLDRALSSTYAIAGVAELNRQWQEFLKR